MLDYPRTREWLPKWTAYEAHWRVERKHWQNECLQNPNAQEAVRRVVKESLEAFFNLLVWTHDPRIRTGPKTNPLILFPYQIDMLAELEAHYQAGRDEMVEKSRDMGATWVIGGWTVHKWLFEDGFNCLWGSRKEDYVDNGQVDSIFGKLDFIIQHLPDWMLPEGYFNEERKPGRNRRKKPTPLILNPVNDNFIAGESTNEDFSRSGRYSMILMDEFAHWAVSREAYQATGDSTRCRIVISTPKGRGNKWGDLRYPDENEGKLDRLTLWWWFHPDKDEEWYAGESERRDPVELAQEVDISYEKSASGRIYAFWNRGDYAQHSIDYDPLKTLWILWDFGINMTALLWVQVSPPFFPEVIHEYQNKDMDIDHFAGYVRNCERDFGFDPEAYHVGDPAGAARSLLTGTSVVDRLFAAGIQIHMPPKAMCTYDNRIRKTAPYLKITQIDRECEQFQECIENYRDRDGNKKVDVSVSPRPIMIKFSHLRTAFEFGCLMWPEPHLGDLSIPLVTPADETRERWKRATNADGSGAPPWAKARRWI